MINEPDRRKISEVFILRAIACLSVVAIHSIILSYHASPDVYLISMMNDVKVLFSFGTPTFVFISILLVSHSYPNGLPKNFLTIRAKFLLLPYLSMAVFYAIFFHILDSSNYVVDFYSTKLIFHYSLINIIGGYHGYFILIIFQLFLLYYFLNSYLSKKSPLPTIIIALFINLAYLAVFNFLPSPSDNIAIDYFWSKWNRIPFIGWVFYFTLAYYCGRNYSRFLYLLYKNEKIIIASTIPIGIVTIILVDLNIIPSSSKSVMMVFFTTSMIGAIYSICKRIKKVPYLVMKISQYSFPIYLLHMFLLFILNKAIEVTDIELGAFRFIILFLGSIMGSIFIAYIFNKFTFGKYIVGRVNDIGIKPKEKPIPIKNSTNLSGKNI